MTHFFPAIRGRDIVVIHIAPPSMHSLEDPLLPHNRHVSKYVSNLYLEMLKCVKVVANSQLVFYDNFEMLKTIKAVC